MDETIPKLKLFGVIVFLGLLFQFLSLISEWFTINGTEFSIRGISSSYQIEVMTQDCSTLEKNEKFLCFCDSHCEALQEIYEQGWGCSVLLLISMNLFLSEIFLTRRKIWRLEGYVLSPSLIDKNFILLVGIGIQNFSVFYWMINTYKFQGLYFGKGLSLSLFSSFLNIVATFFYCLKLRHLVRGIN
jgi:hypothetical protein